MGISTVEILGKVTPEAVEDINRLLAQLSPNLLPVTAADLAQIIAQSTVFVVRAGDAIVGMAALVTAFVPGALIGFLESVVVDETHQGQGVGEALVRAAMALAAERRVTRLELTTSNRRAAANRLYQRLGFVRRDTNVYRYTPPR